MDRRFDDCTFFVSEAAWDSVPEVVRAGFRVLWGADQHVRASRIPCLLINASEIVGPDAVALPAHLITSETRYLIYGDVPLAALLSIPSILQLHKPDQRAHLTQDANAVRRALVSHLRNDPLEGLVDAFMMDAYKLVLIQSNLKRLSVNVGDIPYLSKLGVADRQNFEIDIDGSFLYWPKGEIHMGLSQILQATDPEYLAEIEIRRNELDYTGDAISAWRQELGIRQAEIEGFSERQVRRIEHGASRLTSQSAELFAKAFGLSLAQFINELAERTRTTRDQVKASKRGDADKERYVVVLREAA